MGEEERTEMGITFEGYPEINTEEVNKGLDFCNP